MKRMTLLLLIFFLFILFIALVTITMLNQTEPRHYVTDVEMDAMSLCQDSVALFEEDLLLLADALGQKIKYIVVHCTAVPPQVKLTVESLMRIFRERGWKTRPGYHFFIDKDGTLHNLWQLNGDNILEWHEVVWGAKGYNSVAIHISYDGGLDYNYKPKDTRNLEQTLAINAFISTAKAIWPDAEVIGHNQISNKACPSFDVKKEF